MKYYFYTLYFLGGPLDGQKLNLRETTHTWQVPMQTKPRFTSPDTQKDVRLPIHLYVRSHQHTNILFMKYVGSSAKEGGTSSAK